MSDKELKRCPCGKTPDHLCVDGDRSKWAYTYGDCCGEWNIEFRSNHFPSGSIELKELALKAWNGAPRPK